MNEEKEMANVQAGAGNFGECLVEGSAEEKKRGRKIKRRAIAVSIALQSAGLTALVIAPMLAKPPEIRTTSAMPIPPYSAPRPVHAATTTTIDNVRRPCVVCPTAPIAPITQSLGHTDMPPGDPIMDSFPTGPSSPEGLNIFDSRTQPKQPIEPPKRQVRVYEPHIDAALLMRRVEPAYPTIPKQLHRSGRVELHAIIAADGTIQSLQVVSGDALFVRSALDAVGQWRYRPTLLNGQPVEVDTFITVIYTLNSQ